MDDLQYLQSKASSTTIRAILDQTCDKALLDALDSLIQRARSSRRLHFRDPLSTDIAARLPVGGNVWNDIRLYCKRRLNDDLLSPFYLLECLLCIYQPVDTGAWIAPSILTRLEPHLLFDDDHLLFGPRELLQFEKEGILTEKHFLLYDSALPGAWRSGGFIDDLLRIVAHVSPTHFSVAVTSDAMLARDWYFSSFAKAYIRGPRGLSLEILQDLQFPQDPSGTVTVHQRVDDDPLLRLFPLHRLEVMWSSREGVKSVQIEELVEMGNERATTPQGIANRYIHARWNAEKQRFAHFDGAVRIYTPESYTERLKSDLKKFEGKAAIYRKLFRLDAPLDIATWSRLVAKFFEDNELALEYLGGPEDDEQ